MPAPQRRTAYLGDVGTRVLAELMEDPAASRAAIGLGGAATRAVGTTAGTVAAGDDARFHTFANIRYASDYIPAGTDTTGVNCSPWIQQAINDAGAGGRIIINGRYRCDTELVLLNQQTLEGTANWLGTNPGITANCLDFRQVTANAAQGNTKVGIRTGFVNTIRDILITGPGPTVTASRGISSDTAAQSPRLYNVQCFQWGRGVHLTGAYYTKMYDCEFTYNGIGVYADACYDLNLYGCKFTCRANDLSSYGTGIHINGAARGLTMHGGSIEDYTTGIQVGNNSTVSINGVYFEVLNTAPSVGIAAAALTGVSVSVRDCSVYLINHTSWVNMSTGTQCTLVGSGNKFIYSQIAAGDGTPAPTTPVAYNIGSSMGDVDLSGDNWRDVYYAFPNQDNAYTSNAWTGGGVTNYDVRFPLNDNGNRHLNHYVGRNVILPAGKTVTAAGVKLPIAAKTAAYTATANDNIITGDATGGAFSITLPTAVGIPGRSYTIKRLNSGGNAVTVATTSSQTIDGASTVGLSAQWQSVRVVSDGANWIVA